MVLEAQEAVVENTAGPGLTSPVSPAPATTVNTRNNHNMRLITYNSHCHDTMHNKPGDKIFLSSYFNYIRYTVHTYMIYACIYIYVKGKRNKYGNKSRIWIGALKNNFPYVI